MTKGLARKKRICTGHRTSLTHMLNQVDKTLTPTEPDLEIDTSKLSQLKLSLQKKLDTLDDEILNLLPEDEAGMTGEIEQADAFKEKIYTAMVQIEKHVCPPTTSTSHSPTRRSEPESVSVSLEPPLTRSSCSTCVKLPKLALMATLQPGQHSGIRLSHQSITILTCLRLIR